MFPLKRQLYLCCYDISDDRHRKRVKQIIGSFACGGQKSAYECFLSPSEHSLLINLCQQYLDEQDSLVVHPIRSTDTMQVLGLGEIPVNLGFILFD